jgi:broad specificity phosphatase PhoE
MSRLRRVVMIRHGETEGESSVRFHGKGDPALSAEGHDHVRAASRGIRGESFDAIVASPLRRSWESARILAGGAPFRLEGDFREVDFGRWEGLTAEEIQASDPVLYEDWRNKAPGFEFPGGEARKDFVTRVQHGFARLQKGGITRVLLVLHKGPIRVISEELLEDPLPPEIPELGGIVAIGRGANGKWSLGRRGSNPPGVE